MAATSAERQRRYRAHKAGDHSGCDPARCDGTGVTVSRVTDAPRNADGPRVPRLGRRGRWLWGELAEKANPAPSERVLIEEACRLVDRLDRLDAISNGKDRAWLVVEVSDDGTEVTVVVDKVLSEARQQQLALKQILGELRQASAGGKQGASRDGGSIVDQLAARRTARLADAAGS
jgi:hypothetical protein